MTGRLKCQGSAGVQLCHEQRAEAKQIVAQQMPYKPIESYGLIGNLHTIALVSIEGSINWCCLPQFYSPSISTLFSMSAKEASLRSRASTRLP